jgi:DNA-binding NarL/FixJ family response regulator
VRVVIAEDLALLRDGLKRLLTDSGFEVVAAVADGDALVRAVMGHKPDVCVVDVRLPPTFTDEGIRAALEARSRMPGLPVLVLSQYVERTFAAELLSDGRGGVGYLLKDRVADLDEFLDAVRRVAAGGSALDPQIINRLLQRGRSTPLDELTTREREVLALMAEGQSNQGIADKLVVTEHTVVKHITGILRKLDIPSATEGHRRVLAVLAYLSARASAG